MKSKTGDIWFPIWIDKWIFGSTRLELEPDERSVWLDLLALSYKDKGYIRANEGCPYQTKQLAGLLVVSEELLKRTIQKCCSTKIKKLEIKEDGTIYVPSYHTYRLSERHTRRFNSMSTKMDTMSTKTDTQGEVADTRSDQIRSDHKEKSKHGGKTRQNSSDPIQDETEKIVTRFENKIPGVKLNYGIVKNMLMGQKGFEVLSCQMLLRLVDQLAVSVAAGRVKEPLTRFVDMARKPAGYLE